VHELLAERNFARDTKVLTAAYCNRKGWRMISCAFPIIDVVIAGLRELRLQFVCDNWDDQPPSITLLNPDGTPWGSQLPGGVFNPGPHPIVGRSFICMAGAREYHTHSSHLGETWASHRGKPGMDLVGILTQLDSAWEKARIS
jgi:hypothetical protein